MFPIFLAIRRDKVNDSSWARTNDILGVSETLYQLSYATLINIYNILNYFVFLSAIPGNFSSKLR